MPNLSYFEAALDMRRAIDRMELSMMGAPEIIDLPEKWGEPRLRDGVTTTITLEAEQVYRICDALSELTRIINSDDYVFEPRVIVAES